MIGNISRGTLYCGLWSPHLPDVGPCMENAPCFKLVHGGCIDLRVVLHVCSVETWLDMSDARDRKY